MNDIPAPPKHRLRRLLAIGGLLTAAVWFILLDSHSLARRLSWHHEYRTLQAENDQLRREVAALEATLAEPVSDEMIEKIAREQYGMRRPGETVYRVEEKAE